MKKFITKMLQGAAVALSLVSFASCGSKEDPTVAVTGVSLNKTAVELTEGATVTLEATVNPSNATEKAVTWSSDNASVATVSNGTVTAVKAGSATVTVTTKDGGKTARCAVTVKPKVIEVRSIKLTDAKGGSRGQAKVGDTFTLQVAFDPADATDRSLVWEATTECGRVDDKGNVTALTLGDCVIRATSANGVSGDYYFVIEPVLAEGITVQDPDGRSEGSVTVGKTLQLKATVTPANTTRKPEWSSSDRSVAEVDGEGLVTGVKAGSATITASVDGKSASYRLTVSLIKVTGIEVTPSTLTITAGQTRQLVAKVLPETASIQSVKWTSSNDKAASVDRNGLLTAIAEGKTRIYATADDGSGISGTCEVTVEADKTLKGIGLIPTVMDLTVGESKTLTVTYDPENAADKSVSWLSDNPSVASVSDGKVTGVSEGTAVITATSGEGGFKATCTVTVSRTMPQGTKVFYKTGHNYLYMNGELLYSYPLNGFALYEQDVYTWSHQTSYHSIEKNGNSICSVPYTNTNAYITGFTVIGTNAYSIEISGKSAWLVTVDLAAGTYRRTDFLEEQSAYNLASGNFQLAVAEDGTAYVLSGVKDEYDETHVCLYQVTPDGNHTRTLLCKALNKTDGNGNSVADASEAAPLGIAVSEAGDVYAMIYKNICKNGKNTYTAHLYKNGAEIRVYEDFWLNDGYGIALDGEDVFAYYRMLLSDGSSKSVILKNGSLLYEFTGKYVRSVQVNKAGDVYYVISEFPKYFVYKNNDLLYSADVLINDLQLME